VGCDAGAPVAETTHGLYNAYLTLSPFNYTSCSFRISLSVIKTLNSSRADVIHVMNCRIRSSKVVASYGFFMKPSTGESAKRRITAFSV